jgi:DNA-binding transcriptional LysR family regulator
MDVFHLINEFVAVVDTNGFAGARALAAHVPLAVKRAIKELETHFGFWLLTRTARNVRVTDAGENGAPYPRLNGV